MVKPITYSYDNRSNYSAVRVVNEKTDDRVLELFSELSTLYAQKQSDYSGDNDPFKNFRRSEKIGTPAWKGAVVRMMDKWSRIETLINKERFGEGPAVTDESLIDTLKDNAVYSLIVIALYEEAKLAAQGIQK